VEAKALGALLAARQKKDWLCKQRKLLKRREQQWVDESGKFVEDIEALEASKGLNREIALLEDGIIPGTLALDWSAYMLSFLDSDPSFDDLVVDSYGTVLAASGSL
jgi:hypothetical protein